MIALSAGSPLGLVAPLPVVPLVLADGPMLPMPLVVPTALAVNLLLAGHVIAVSRSDEPGSRKRIRACNGVVMMLGVALMATGVSILDPDRHTGLWILCWIAAFCVVWFSMVLAGIDAANTYRISRVRRRELQERLRLALTESRDRLSAERH